MKDILSLLVHFVDGSVIVNNVLQVLRSSEGRELRAKHQETVRYLRGKLLEAGLPVIHTPSHIIPVHVGSDAFINENIGLNKIL